MAPQQNQVRMTKKKRTRYYVHKIVSITRSKNDEEEKNTLCFGFGAEGVQLSKNLQYTPPNFLNRFLSI